MTHSGISARSSEGKGLWHRLGRQLACPSGSAGRLLGRLMIPLNNIPNRLAIEALAPHSGEDILEVGFGPGAGLAEILRRAPTCQIAGLDHSTEMVAAALHRNRGADGRTAMDLRQGDMCHLPWPEGSFDKILAVNVAYFFDAQGAAAGELFRVLRPGGRLSLYVTDRNTMAAWQFAGPETHRTYDREDLLALLSGAGFDTAQIRIGAIKLGFGMKGWLATADRMCESA